MILVYIGKKEGQNGNNNEILMHQKNWRMEEKVHRVSKELGIAYWKYLLYSTFELQHGNITSC